MCPLDVVCDKRVSLCEDSHPLSFSVSLYMLSIEIAPPLQRWMSHRLLSAGPLLTSPLFDERERLTAGIFQLFNDAKQQSLG